MINHQNIKYVRYMNAVVLYHMPSDASMCGDCEVDFLRYRRCSRALFQYKAWWGSFRHFIHTPHIYHFFYIDNSKCPTPKHRQTHNKKYPYKGKIDTFHLEIWKISSIFQYWYCVALWYFLWGILFTTSKYCTVCDTVWHCIAMWHCVSPCSDMVGPPASWR